MLNNNLTTFEGGYAPGNYHNDTRYTGDITARTALQFSQNNATVSLAQMVGYNNVAALARDAGMKSARGTPSVALGSYDATPLDMAGAYTTFANGGVRIDPWLVASVRSASGDVLNDYPPNSKPILDPRVAYLTLALMENVVNAGTGATIRAIGFTAPAAGKTGTSHDAWFAGFTSNLLCVVWIGNDDYTDLKLEGGKTAAPIWADFMKHAVQLPQYSDTRQFPTPTGVSTVRLDKVTNLLCGRQLPARIMMRCFSTGPHRRKPATRAPAISGMFSRSFLVLAKRPLWLLERRRTECLRCPRSRRARRQQPLRPSRDLHRLLPTSSRRRKRASSEDCLGKGDNDNKQQQVQPSSPQPQLPKKLSYCTLGRLSSFGREAAGSRAGSRRKLRPSGATWKPASWRKDARKCCAAG